MKVQKTKTCGIYASLGSITVELMDDGSVFIGYREFERSPLGWAQIGTESLSGRIVDFTCTRGTGPEPILTVVTGGGSRYRVQGYLTGDRKGKLTSLDALAG